MLHASSHTFMFSWTSNIPKYKTKHHVIPQGAKLCSLATNIIFLLLHLPPLDFPEVYASTSMRKVSQLIHPSINLAGGNALGFSTHPPKCCEAGNSSPSTCCRTAAEALVKGDQNDPRSSFVRAARKSGEKNSFRVDVGGFELVHDLDFNGWHCGSILLASSIITNPCRKPQTQNKHNSHTN